MRIADSMNYGQVKSNLRKNRSEASELQNQAASMKRVTKPSDDPVGTTRVLSARTAMSGIDQYKKDLNMAQSFLEATDHALEELTEVFMRAKELAVGQANAPSSSPITRRTVATEVDQLHQQVVQTGNRMLGERYIFGGYKTTEPPFQTTGTYNGDDGSLVIEVNRNAYLPMNVPGSKVFEGLKLGTRTVIRDERDTAPRTLEDIERIQRRDEEKMENTNHEDSIKIRGLASVQERASEIDSQYEGENLFDVLRTFSVALKTSDTPSIQRSIERIDEAMDQIVNSRAQVGSRAMTLDTVLNTLQKSKIDAKVQASHAEDADAFELFSEIKKNEQTLQATLDTSGRLLQASLLDFLR